MFAFGIHNLGNFCLRNLVSWTLEQNTAQGIRNLNPLQRPESSNWNLEVMAWNPEFKTGIRDLRLGIKNSRLEYGIYGLESRIQDWNPESTAWNLEFLKTFLNPLFT